jgi:hypothetical protein|tara:strand:+ start:562 stop:849 length:288 start_codon:yes stop_codon:yes gene_type:complete
VNNYNPQSQRKRNGAPEISPVDTLLENSSTEKDPIVESQSPASGTPISDSEISAQPFETPPVEMTDERVDRLYRIGVFAAVVAVILLLVRRKRRQ